MKKTIILLLSAVCILTLTACEYGTDIAVGGEMTRKSTTWLCTDEIPRPEGDFTDEFAPGDCPGVPLETGTMVDTICPPPDPDPDPDPLPDYTKPFPPTLPAKMELEFWITDDVSGVDFSDHAEVDGWFGAREYYGLGYAPTANEDGTYPPPYSVKYLITAYPDYADGGQYVTRIEITDPAVEVYGFTVDSDLSEFDQVMTELGFRLSENYGGEYSHDFTRLGVHFRFDRYPGDTLGKLIIWAEITNREGISY